MKKEQRKYHAIGFPENRVGVSFLCTLRQTVDWEELFTVLLGILNLRRSTQARVKCSSKHKQ